MAVNNWRRVATGLVLFGISFGYVEASVVVYLRAVYDPIRQRLRPDRPTGELFPLIGVGQLRSAAPEKSWLLDVEIAREASTMVMLASVAFVAALGGSPWLPSFAIMFGTWDLFFYVFLKVLLHWPVTIMTWDTLFLIPVPWAAPVLAPSIVSMTIISAGLLALSRPIRMFPAHWVALTLGGALILISFTWDYQNLMAGGLPSGGCSAQANSLAWRLFFMHSGRRNPERISLPKWRIGLESQRNGFSKQSDLANRRELVPFKAGTSRK